MKRRSIDPKTEAMVKYQLALLVAKKDSGKITQEQFDDGISRVEKYLEERINQGG